MEAHDTYVVEELWKYRTFYVAYILFLESSRATAKKCGLRVLDKYCQHGMKDIFQAKSNAKLWSFKLILISFLHLFNIGATEDMDGTTGQAKLIAQCFFET